MILSTKYLGTGGILAVLLLTCGCQMPGFDERMADATAFRTNLREETDAFFAMNPAPLTLETGWRLARERTLKLTRQELALQVAGIDRSMAFSAFLPQVETTFTRSGTNDPITYTVMGQSVQMQSQYVSESAVTLTQPIFTPGAWLLFVESKNAVRVQELVHSRAAELLDVQVASLFYRAAVAEEMLTTYERQREATQALVDRIDALAREGYVLDAQRERARARLLSDTYNVRLAKDSIALARAGLFEVLHFWPLAAVPIDGASMLQVLTHDWVLTAEDGGEECFTRERVRALTPEEWLWQTLVNRKELWAGDQMLVIRKTEVLRALAGFLPNVYGSVSRNHTSEMLQTPRDFWGGGLSAALSLFSGFQTVNEYREAKARREAEYRVREDRAMSLIVSTFEAYQNWSRVEEQCAVALQARKAAEMDYETTRARFEKDQETLSEVLDKLALMESARVQAATTEYASALAEIVLRDAAGIGMCPPDRSKETEPSDPKGAK